MSKERTHLSLRFDPGTGTSHDVTEELYHKKEEIRAILDGYNGNGCIVKYSNLTPEIEHGGKTSGHIKTEITARGPYSDIQQLEQDLRNTGCNITMPSFKK